LNKISGSSLHWLIVKPLVHQTDVLTLRSRRRGGTSLPVFSHEGEADKFLCYHTEASEGGWRVRQTSASELALLLQRQGAAVQQVVLDPVPEDVAEALVELLSLDREEFVRMLLAEEPSNLRGCTSSLAPCGIVVLTHHPV
jgi:hypothetical protein